MRKFTPIKIDRRLSYSNNLATAINTYWGDTVAVSDGSTSLWEGNVICPSKNGIPDRIRARWPKQTHRDIIRCYKIEGTNRWGIIDAEQSTGRTRSSEHDHQDRNEGQAARRAA